MEKRKWDSGGGDRSKRERKRVYRLREAVCACGTKQTLGRADAFFQGPFSHSLFCTFHGLPVPFITPGSPHTMNFWIHSSTNDFKPSNAAPANATAATEIQANNYRPLEVWGTLFSPSVHLSLFRSHSKEEKERKWKKWKMKEKIIWQSWFCVYGFVFFPRCSRCQTHMDVSQRLLDLSNRFTTPRRKACLFSILKLFQTPVVFVSFKFFFFD
jgi:hypothetical protein